MPLQWLPSNIGHEILISIASQRSGKFDTMYTTVESPDLFSRVVKHFVTAVSLDQVPDKSWANIIDRQNWTRSPFVFFPWVEH